MDNTNTERGPNTTHVVSMWHIPSGCDYTNAMVKKFFFDSEEEAEKFAKPYAMPPEMAMIIPVEDWDLIQEKAIDDFESSETL